MFLNYNKLQDIYYKLRFFVVVKWMLCEGSL